MVSKDDQGHNSQKITVIAAAARRRHFERFLSVHTNSSENASTGIKDGIYNLIVIWHSETFETIYNQNISELYRVGMKIGQRIY